MILEINKHKLTGCNLLSNDMLYHIKKYGVIYVGSRTTSICILKREINNILERESMLLGTKAKKAYYDDNENILALK